MGIVKFVSDLFRRATRRVAAPAAKPEPEAISLTRTPSALSQPQSSAIGGGDYTVEENGIRWWHLES